MIWLHDVKRVRDKFDQLRFDASGAIGAHMFDEAWPRCVTKLATGAGKTKVLSLLALQLDVTATPRHDNGAIFVQTVSDCPLVAAIHQNVVIEDHIRLLDTRPFRTQPSGFVATKKSVFKRMVGEAGEAGAGGLEREFAAFLEAAPAVQAHAKNCLAAGFRIGCVRDAAGGVWIVETRGREELDLPRRWHG